MCVAFLITGHAMITCNKDNEYVYLKNLFEKLMGNQIKLRILLIKYYIKYSLPKKVNS